jgi:cell division protein FtsI (penicillin-binding protein 3)
MMDIKPQLRWITFFQVAIVLVAAGIVARLYHIQFTRASHYWEHAKARQEYTIKKVPSRGKIFDRSNQELASTEIVPSIYVAPSRIAPNLKRDLAHELAAELGLDFDTVYARLTRSSGDQVLKRRVAPETVDRVLLLAHMFRQRYSDKHTTLTVAPNAFYVQEENKRIYPRKDFACHIIGYTRLDNTGDNLGVAGVEKSCDEELRGKMGVERALRTANGIPLEPIDPEVLSSTYGNSVVLTIDARIQLATENALRKQVISSSADAGVAIVYGVKTGEVLAMASVPSFSLDDVAHAAPVAMRNRAIADAIEPGSVMKIFTYASLLEEDKIQSFKEIVDCSGGRWTVAGRTVVDSHALGAVPIVTAFAESSNVAAAKLATMRLQPARFYKHLLDFGFGEKTGIDLPGEAPGLLRHVKDWTAQSVASLAYGYELQVTAVQVVAAASAIVNEGIYMKPHVVKEIRNYRGETVRQVLPERLRRVCSATTSHRMRELMDAVVREGTGKPAAVPGYHVGGKTGTTIKLDPETKRYSRGSYIGSFCGVAPLDDPEICVYIWIDNPRGGAYYGGQVAAPVFKEIAQTALKVLNIPPSEGSEVPPAPSSFNVALRDSRELPAAGLLEPAPQDDPVAPGCMPDLRGLTMREAHERLAALELPFEVRGSGVVIDQTPKPYETIDPKETVQLVFGTEEQFRDVLVAQERTGGSSQSDLQQRAAIAPAAETPVLKIVGQRRSVEIPLSAEPTTSGDIALARGLPRPDATPSGGRGEDDSPEDPDPRVRRGPAPDAGRNVWKKVVEDTLQTPSASAAARKATDDAAPAPETTPAGPVRSMYQVRQTAGDQSPDSSESER